MAVKNNDSMLAMLISAFLEIPLLLVRMVRFLFKGIRRLVRVEEKRAERSEATGRQPLSKRQGRSLYEALRISGDPDPDFTLSSAPDDSLEDDPSMDDEYFDDDEDFDDDEESVDVLEDLELCDRLMNEGSDSDILLTGRALFRAFEDDD